MKKIFTLLFLANSILTIANENIIRKISVTGNVERKITPNIATITFEAKSKKTSLTEATKDINNKIEKFKSSLQKQKINFNNFETVNINNYKSSEDIYDEEILDFKGIKDKKEQNENQKNITGYDVNVTFLVKTNNFNKIVEILGFDDDELLQSIVKNYDEDAYTFSISESDKTIDNALTKVFNKFNLLKNKLITNNIDEKDIILGEYEINKNYENYNNKTQDYFIATNEFRFETNNIKQLNTIISLANDEDINISGNINFNISNREEIESEMYNDAFNQAKNKATSILKSSKMKLSSPLVVSEDSSFQEKMINRIDESWTVRAAAPMAANYNYSDLESSIQLLSAKSPGRSNKVDYNPKPITISQNISVMYEIKESEEK